MYHLLEKLHVYIKFRIKSSALECLLPWFFKLTRILDQILIVYIGIAAVIGDL
jgi:hypothetical protein